VSTADTDPRATLSIAPMSVLQIVAVAITVGLNALDGFDVLSISFASPGIAAEWHVAQKNLGFILSMELFGMAIGSIVLGAVADKIGRRPTVLGCLVLMSVGMLMVTTATGPTDLSAWRLLTGFGIGGVLASINAISAEFCNARRKNLGVAIMAIGYPVGAVLGGKVVQVLLKTSDWRSVFYFGAAATVAFIPLVWLWVPESVPWLAQKQPVNALAKINRTLKRMGHAVVEALPPLATLTSKASLAEIFGPTLIVSTAIVTAAYFFHIMTFYFVLKWIPKVIHDMGFSASSAAGVLVWANLGGAAGGTVLGLLGVRYGMKSLTVVVMIASAIMVNVYGRSPHDLTSLALICACTGFFTNGAVVGMYAIFAQVFPTHLRAFGTGFAIGVGRGGSALGPVIAGYLFENGYGLATVATTMSVAALCAAIILSLLRMRPRSGESVPAATGDGAVSASL
jgi:benzoate transport